LYYSINILLRRIAQDFCRKTRSKNRRALAGRKVFCDAVLRQKDKQGGALLCWWSNIENGGV
jgi:hypothetical protein